MRTRLLLTTLGAVMVGVAGLELLPTGSSAGTEPSRSAELSVSVDDRQAELAPGDRVRYTIQVHNVGDRSYRDAWISHELPAALTPLTSRPAAGHQSRERVGWSATIPAGADATFVMTARVGESRYDYPQVVTTGCVLPGPGVRPLACDSDSDALQLPARSPMGSVLLLGIGGTIGAAVLVVRYWPRRKRQPVRPIPRRPFRSGRPLRPVYVGSRTAVPASTGFLGQARWSSTNPARGPPAG